MFDLLRSIVLITIAGSVLTVLPAKAGEAEGGLRYTITVSQFENRAGWNGQWSIGDAWDTVLTDMLNQTGKFIVLGETGMRNAAVTNLSVTLANELGPKGITVNTLQPGAVETETLRARLPEMAEQQGVDVETLRERIASQNAIRRVVTAGEIGDVAAFLASPLSVAINGESISVAGGTPNVYY